MENQGGQVCLKIRGKKEKKVEEGEKEEEEKEEEEKEEGEGKTDCCHDVGGL